jgi:hypothetical protein
MRHHAIVVTTGLDSRIDTARQKAKELGMTVTGIADEVTNGYMSFLVAPDGSKEGWEESAAGDERRIAFKNWLRSQEYEDGSSPFAWVEVMYGDDNDEVAIVDDDRHAYREGTDS